MGVIDDSIDNPHGDHVDRTAEATATTNRTAISTDIEVEASRDRPRAQGMPGPHGRFRP